MHVRVRLFAVLRERAGADELEPRAARWRVALATRSNASATLTDGVPVVMAVNQEYAEPTVVLHPGDELALIPPVSGGSVGPMHVRVTDRAADARSARRAGPRSARRRRRHLHRSDPRGRRARLRGVRSRWPSARSRRSSRRRASATGCAPPPPSIGSARSRCRSRRWRRRFGAPPRRRVRRSPRDHRSDQGPGADLEEGGG